jgi:hypothetical protein
MSNMQANFETENGKAWIAIDKDNNSLFVPVIIAKEKGKGMGTKLVEELENYALKGEFKEIVFPNILSLSLLAIMIKRRYQVRMEYDDHFGENIKCWFKVFKKEG